MKLKFKVWDTVLNRWNFSIEIDCYGRFQEYKYNGSAFYAKYKNDFEDGYEDVSDRFIICWFTGLFDKNGKEIYEGDILQFKHYYIGIKWWSTVEEIPKIKKLTEEGRKNYQNHKESVYFRDGAFKISGLYLHQLCIINNKIENIIKTGQTHCNDFEEKYWDFEVVGNIYQNPELLNYEL